MAKAHHQPTKGNGKAYRWIVEHIDYQGGDCIQWPFCRLPQGPGILGHNGRHWRAARLMCTLAHGEPPTPEHEAAHSCGRGHEACMNPRHLSWKTRSENRLDSRQHGTSARNRHGASGKLTYAQAEEIRALKGKEVAFSIAKRYGVHFNTVYIIWSGKTFKSDKPVNNPKWTEAEYERLLEAVRLNMNNEEATAHVGRRPREQVVRQIRRLGLRSTTALMANNVGEVKENVR